MLALAEVRGYMTGARQRAWIIYIHVYVNASLILMPLHAQDSFAFIYNNNAFIISPSPRVRQAV